MKCPNCGFSLNGDESVCPNCGYNLREGESTPPSPPSPPEPETEKAKEKIYEKLTVPFSDSSIPFFDRLLATIKLVLFNPTEFFSKYDFSNQLTSGLIFGATIGFIAGIFSAIYNLLFRGSLLLLISKWGHFPYPKGMFAFQGLATIFSSIMYIIFFPIWVTLGIFIGGGIYHLLLMLVKGANEKFEYTISVVSYNTATLLFAIVPFCGNVISWIYGIVLNIIGLKEVHKTTTGKASFAVLFPYLFCCLCIILYFAIFFGILGYTFSHCNAH